MKIVVRNMETNKEKSFNMNPIRQVLLKKIGIFVFFTIDCICKKIAKNKVFSHKRNLNLVMNNTLGTSVFVNDSVLFSI